MKPARRLALLALDLEVPAGGDAAVEALLVRLAQVVRNGTEAGGVKVGDVRRLLVDGVDVAEFFAALAARRDG